MSYMMIKGIKIIFETDKVVGYWLSVSFFEEFLSFENTFQLQKNSTLVKNVDKHFEIKLTTGKKYLS